MKGVFFFAISCFLNLQLFAQTNNNWNGTSEEKVSGLMTIWSQVKFGFPHTDRLNIINWDSVAQSFIPKVLATKNLNDYYKVLM